MLKAIVIIIAIIIVAKLYLKFKKTSKDNKQSNNLKSTNNSYATNNYDMFDNYEHFASIMDIALTFIDAYLQEVPGEWLHFYVSKISEKGDYSTSSYYTYDVYIEVSIVVGRWYDNIIRRNIQAKDDVEGIFNFDSSENTFSYRIKIGHSVNCSIPNDLLNKKLFEYINRYEQNNPNRKLNREPFGIAHSWNL